MIRLSKPQILLLHEQLIAETGGSSGLRDEGMLDSALNAPFQTFGGDGVSRRTFLPSAWGIRGKNRDALVSLASRHLLWTKRKPPQDCSHEGWAIDNRRGQTSAYRSERSRPVHGTKL